LSSNSFLKGFSTKAMLSKSYVENYKINIKLAYPIMLGQVGHILTGIADSIMVATSVPVIWQPERLGTASI